MKINRTSPDKEKFSQIITNIAYAPKTLYYIGKLPAERIPTVAIVGSRKPTPYGQEVTYRLAYDLAKQGVVIVSGLALGIDSIAHRAALDAGGTTIAILASGVLEITPRSHRALAEQIIKSGGAIMSEYEPPTTARAYQFLARNRLISGLSDMIIVTEATNRSGSLSTAHHGLSQNREVGAIPGPVTSPMSSGTNALIKQGAHVITSAQDVLEIIAPQLSLQQPEIFAQNTSEATIISLLKKGIRDGDQLAQQSGLTPAEFLETLTLMELAGTIRSLGGNQWTLR